MTTADILRKTQASVRKARDAEANALDEMRALCDGSRANIDNLGVALDWDGWPVVRLTTIANGATVILNESQAKGLAGWIAKHVGMNGKQDAQ